jgi:homoserine O-succinyltransferase
MVSVEATLKLPFFRYLCILLAIIKTETMEGRLKLAVIDLYDGTPNQGMRAIKEILGKYEDKITYETFELRSKCEVPDKDEFDIFISSGGPGDPREGDGVWDRAWADLVEAVWQHNLIGHEPKKYMFFICHSFQMAVIHFGLARVVKRMTRSFGTFPCHKTVDGQKDPFFAKLPDPFCIADFRNFQVIGADEARFEQMGAKLLAREKIRPHVPLERAIMAIRFSDELFGTQFHPEADPEGMLLHFRQPEEKEEIIEHHGLEKYEQMIEDLSAPDCIPRTNATVIPSFLEHAIGELELAYQPHFV